MLKYLEWCFANNIRYEWKRSGTEDEAIETLLDRARYLSVETC